MIKRDIKTLLKIHLLTLKILRRLKQFTGKTKDEVTKEEDKWAKFQHEYIKVVEDHDLTIEEEMFWALSVLNVGVHRIFDTEAEYDPRVRKYGTEKFGKGDIRWRN